MILGLIYRGTPKEVERAIKKKKSECMIAGFKPTVRNAIEAPDVMPDNA